MTRRRRNRKKKVKSILQAKNAVNPLRSVRYRHRVAGNR